MYLGTDSIQENLVYKDKWIRQLKDLWSTKQEGEPPVSATTDVSADSITAEELTETIKYGNNEKAPVYGWNKY
jgi:hypothetical protein